MCHEQRAIVLSQNATLKLEDDEENGMITESVMAVKLSVYVVYPLEIDHTVEP